MQARHELHIVMQFSIPSSTRTKTWEEQLKRYDEFEMNGAANEDYSEFSKRVAILQECLKIAQEDELSD